ncbi:photosystem I P700 apoprotein A2 [Tanacetum coccineum]
MIYIITRTSIVNAYPIYTQQGYENPLEAYGRIVCANCHLANKPVDIEVPQVVLPDTVFEVVVRIPYDMQLKQVLANCKKGGKDGQSVFSELSPQAVGGAQGSGSEIEHETAVAWLREPTEAVAKASLYRAIVTAYEPEPGCQGRYTWCNSKHQFNLGGGDLVAVGGKVALLPIPLGTADFLVHHIYAFTIHVTVLILLKGILFARSSRLIPDIANLGFRFPCDGPGRGVRCLGQYKRSRSSSSYHGRKLREDLKGIMALRFPGFSQGLAQDPTTRCIWFGIATAHDFESHDDITEERLYQNIFASHFGQLAIMFLWTSGNLFLVAWQGNFESLVQDPLHVRPIAHAIWDPYFGQPAVEAFTQGGALGPVNITYYGVYQWWYTIESRLNHHLSGLFGVNSLAWTRHLVHVAILASKGEYVRWNNFLDVLPHPQGLGSLFTAIAFIFLIAGHMYKTNFGIGHSMKDLLDAHIPLGGRLGRGHKGLYDTINNSIHFQLGLALASLGVITYLGNNPFSSCMTHTNMEDKKKDKGKAVIHLLDNPASHGGVDEKSMLDATTGPSDVLPDLGPFGNVFDLPDGGATDGNAVVNEFLSKPRVEPSYVSNACGKHQFSVGSEAQHTNMVRVTSEVQGYTAYCHTPPRRKHEA